MTEANDSRDSQNIMERKTRILIMGVSLGAMCGLISSYLYTRADAESDGADASAPRSISTGQLLAVLLAILGVIRQVAELGKPKKPRKK